MIDKVLWVTVKGRERLFLDNLHSSPGESFFLLPPNGWSIEKLGDTSEGCNEDPTYLDIRSYVLIFFFFWQKSTLNMGDVL